ncbi:hypothetical protein PMIN03_012472 [Paraphaeosphaeria minitans]
MKVPLSAASHVRMKAGGAITISVATQIRNFKSFEQRKAHFYRTLEHVQRKKSGQSAWSTNCTSYRMVAGCDDHWRRDHIDQHARQSRIAPSRRMCSQPRSVAESG